MILFVGGTFDANGGKSSSVVRKIAGALKDNYGDESREINGGRLDKLTALDFADYDTIVWMPNVDNSADKMLPEIKKANPHAVLVSSKNVYDKEYTEWDVVGRLLATRSNLGFMITREDKLFNFKLLDPLGNMYCDTSDMAEVGRALAERLSYLDTLSRCGSRSIGPARDPLMDEDFMGVVRRTADEFSKHVNANNPNRMLGNASTRCMSGFPAMRDDGKIFVTRRNIDKKTIAADGFIETRMRNMHKLVAPSVEYYGDVKPSVDTPVQLMLFDYFPQIKFMIHGHVYVKRAPFTNTKIPCGYLEEFDEIIEVWEQYGDVANFAVNLLGHGCIVLASDLSFFDEVEYMSRPLPEGTP